MLHLSSERLAELSDGDPTPAEAEHLAACAVCSTERAAHRRLLDLAAGERGRTAAPLTDWDSLSARLRDEGIIASPVGPRQRVAWRAVLRIAASLALIAGGTIFGRLTAAADPLPSAGEMLAGARAVSGGVLGSPNEVFPDAFADRQFESVSEALASLTDAQRQYDRAASFIAVHDSTLHSPDAGEVYRTRLAALDQMAETSLEALANAPADPVLNQYYLSTIGAREVTLRQLGTVLTSGKRLTRF